MPNLKWCIQQALTFFQAITEKHEFMIHQESMKRTIFVIVLVACDKIIYLQPLMGLRQSITIYMFIKI